jgi:cytochrome c oxidase cbb3-type subunit III
MSDFINEFWNVYVIVIVLASILGCAALLWVQSKHQPAKSGAEIETSGHVWDENLEEYNHPLPKWWSYLFYITVVFALVYLVLYPGLGRFQGVYGWSAVKQYTDERARVEAKVAPIYEKFSKMDLKAVAGDKEANEMGRRLFLTYCAQCHGSDAKGSKGFPNLTDADWLYGGEPEQIKVSIAEGRNGMMPPHAHLGGDPIKDLAHYVRSLSGLTADSIRVAKGKDAFATAGCAGCHGPDGKGNPAMGAPNLTDKTWLYGSSEGTITETVTQGRQNRMPAWKDFLGDAKVHLLAGYVYSLGAGAK